MKEEFLIESISAHRLESLDIRVWREEEPGFSSTESMSSVTLTVASAAFDSPSQVAYQILLDDPKINAVEVKDQAGQGVVLYRNWP